DLRHSGLDPESIFPALREWTPDQVRGDETRKDNFRPKAAVCDSRQSPERSRAGAPNGAAALDSPHRGDKQV
ncbi:hypothetical protein, partial [Sphingopyxis soli]|uniref:hypothetical protein n=1 Tax=Sphingopyxis soli TaxID=592051 RepID=UPI001BFDF121